MASMAPKDDLVFVNLSHPDEARERGNQRTIRRRVMRDIGKSRRTRTRPATTFALQPVQAPQAPGLMSLPWTPNPLPVDLNPRACELVHFMHAEADYRYRPFRSIWFSMALCDPSAFKLSMANAAMFLDEAHNPETFRYERSQEALKYYGQCLYVGTWDRWAYHIQGLNQISKMRGGFQGLDDNIRLFACWFDVAGSVVQDSPPRLSCQFSFISNFPTGRALRDSHNHTLFDNILQTSSDAENLALAFDRVLVISDFVNAHFTRPQFWRQEDDLGSPSMLGPATHMLLSLPRFDTSDTGSFEFAHELTRLALLIVLAGLKRAYGLAAAEMGFLQRKLYHLIQGSGSSKELFLLPNLQLWSLLTVALFEAPTERNLYIGEISRRMPTARLHNGTSVVELARGIMWIEPLADRHTIETLSSEIDLVFSAS
ncbi:uncharacterized protein N7459_007862 [Penicillium hispanicum]|uniref:uncharacterized protein n=1 Tax=Penicillium hispanicum TaxID=1080232 RepID=UPI00253FE86D|nr:uncharacterized protein N7459_007862 [Penicillium hispanicum]KAJ5573435.1 hypothetical protein N7459_007862 [Penicillium hispanicum]